MLCVSEWVYMCVCVHVYDCVCACLCVCTCMYTTAFTNVQFISEMADKISDKITSALLAMSLSYYYVMGDHAGKERRMDEILSTLLSWTDVKTYMNTTRMTKGVLMLCDITACCNYLHGVCVCL